MIEVELELLLPEEFEDRGHGDCPSIWDGDPWRCTRPCGHEGPHVAHAGDNPVFAWLDDDVTRETIVSTMIQIVKECT